LWNIFVGEGKKKMDTWFKKVKRFARNKKAISGLETAIVLIAFVIVASAFAYAVLNMGFLATQKSQQVVLGGLQAASSALVVDGPVYGYSNNPGPVGTMTSIIFWLKTASAATSVDLNVAKTTIAFENPRGVWPNVYTGTAATISYTVGSGAGATTFNVVNATSIIWEVGTGFQLVAGQKVRVTIDLTTLTISPTQGITPTDGCVQKNEEFKIVIKPPTGSVLELDRVAPAAVNTVNDLG
jgi:flagellin FlaB